MTKTCTVATRTIPLVAGRSPVKAAFTRGFSWNRLKNRAMIMMMRREGSTVAAVVAIASSYLDKPVPGHMAAVGEVGLSGEIRSINHLEQRLSEVERLGFTQCLIPANRSREIRTFANLKLIPAKNVAQALQILVHGHHS